MQGVSKPLGGLVGEEGAYNNVPTMAVTIVSSLFIAHSKIHRASASRIRSYNIKTLNMYCPITNGFRFSAIEPGPLRATPCAGVANSTLQGSEIGGAQLRIDAKPALGTIDNVDTTVVAGGRWYVSGVRALKSRCKATIGPFRKTMHNENFVQPLLGFFSK